MLIVSPQFLGLWDPFQMGVSWRKKNGVGSTTNHKWFLLISVDWLEEFTLPETNSEWKPLKMDGWNLEYDPVSFWGKIFRMFAVSLREGT